LASWHQLAIRKSTIIPKGLLSNKDKSLRNHLKKLNTRITPRKTKQWTSKENNVENQNTIMLNLLPRLSTGS
jgi:hypothetical protein